MNSYTDVKNCRSCSHALPIPFLDLGRTPLANSYLKSEDELEETFPLAVAFCPNCYLVQITQHINPEKMFKDYAYFSSYSDDFLRHARDFTHELVRDYKLGSNNEQVVEIASNDGYLLQYIKKHTSNILGVEPATNIVKTAIKNGIPTLNDFFNHELAYKLPKADFLIGNNVLAHVPSINDFILGIAECLKEDGIATFEFPYLPTLINKMEFDTIYHEHVFYYSVLSLINLFKKASLELFNVKFLPMHGGSLRIYVQHKETGVHKIESIVSYYQMQELTVEMDQPDYYSKFSVMVNQVAYELTRLLKHLKSIGKIIAAYGAPAKGNTLLNYCNIGKELIDFTVDISPHKQGLFLPGTRIPIYNEEELIKRNPDYALLLPWNFMTAIIFRQQEYLSQGGQFIIPIPKPRIIR